METQRKIYITFAAFAVAVLLLVTVLVYPLLDDIEKSFNEILSAKGRVVFIDMQIKESNNFMKNFDNYEADLKKIDKIFVDSKNPVDFIKFLEKTSSGASIKSDINLTAPEKIKAGGTPVMLFQIFTKGNFLNVLKFSEKIETGPYLVNINNLSIKKSSIVYNDQDIGGNVEANFLIEVLAK